MKRIDNIDKINVGDYFLLKTNKEYLYLCKVKHKQKSIVYKKDSLYDICITLYRLNFSENLYFTRRNLIEHELFTLTEKEIEKYKKIIFLKDV